MRLSGTLSAYIARHFLIWVGGIFLVLAALVFLFDLIELLRRTSGKEGAGFVVVLQMALLKLPELVQTLIPFAVLFGAMLAFFRLTRSRELVVTRAAGVSVWQFLAPSIGLALFIGVIQVAAFDPLSAMLLSKFERLENVVFKGQPSSLSVSSTGLWLRQGNVESEGREGAVLHASALSQSDMTLQNVTVFEFNEDNEFSARLIADSARLGDRVWQMDDVWRLAPTKKPEKLASYTLDTDLTVEKILDSFASPETVSFWHLPTFIEVLEAAGFSAHRHRLHFHSQIATPALLAAMVLIAATFSLHYSRRGGEVYLIALGVLTGFMFYMLTHVVQAMGLSANIPVALAAWTPAGVIIALGISMLLHLEDG